MCTWFWSEVKTRGWLFSCLLCNREKSCCGGIITGSPACTECWRGHLKPASAARGLRRALRAAAGFERRHWSHATGIANFSWIGCLALFPDSGAEPKFYCLWVEKDGLYHCWTWECSELKPHLLGFSWWIWLLLASEKVSRLRILSTCFVFLNKKESKLMYRDSQHPTSQWKIIPRGTSASVLSEFFSAGEGLWITAELVLLWAQRVPCFRSGGIVSSRTGGF